MTSFDDPSRDACFRPRADVRRSSVAAHAGCWRDEQEAIEAAPRGEQAKRCKARYVYGTR